jgi:hypothetical protein
LWDEVNIQINDALIHACLAAKAARFSEKMLMNFWKSSTIFFSLFVVFSMLVKVVRSESISIGYAVTTLIVGLIAAAIYAAISVAANK